MSAPEAFLLFGGFTAGRYPGFLTALSDKGLPVLVIDEPNDRVRAQATGISPASPVHRFHEYRLIRPADRVGLLTHVSEWSDRYRIVGAYTIRESFVQGCGLVADMLGLRGPGMRASIVCRDKMLQRAYLRSFSPGVRYVPPDGRAAAAASHSEFPAILKPTGRQASSGVVRVDDRVQLAAAIDGHPPGEDLLLEEPVDGPEYSVESLLQDGSIVFAGITAKRTNEGTGRNFVEMCHTVGKGHVDGDVAARLLEANRRVLGALAFRDGIAHAEFRVSEHVRLMEIAARNPGDGILALYELSTGYSMEAALIDIALGETASYPDPRRVARQLYLEHEPGRLEDVDLDGLDVTPVWYRERGSRPPLQALPPDAPPAIHEVLVEHRRGTRLGTVEESSDRSASVLMSASTPRQLEDLTQRVLSSVRVVTTPD